MSNIRECFVCARFPSRSLFRSPPLVRCIIAFSFHPDRTCYVLFGCFHPWKQCIRQQQQQQYNDDGGNSDIIQRLILGARWKNWNSLGLGVYRGVSVQYGFGISVSLIFSVWWFKYIHYIVYFYPKWIRDKCMLRMTLYGRRVDGFFCMFFSVVLGVVVVVRHISVCQCCNAANKGTLSSIFWCIYLYI